MNLNAIERSKQFIPLTLILLLPLFLMSFFVRPVQDDYLELNTIAQKSIPYFLASIWESQGGNIWPYFLNSVLLWVSKESWIFPGLSIFYLITLVLTFLASFLLLKQVLGESTDRLPKAVVVLFTILSALSFEGLFVPSFAGAFTFSLASIAHLWPVLLFIFAFTLLQIDRVGIYFLLPLGLMIGNSNAGESFTALMIFSVLFFGRSINALGHNLRMLPIFTVWFGTLVGFTLIVIAPGFKNRAVNSVGFPEDFSELVTRFSKSFISFSVDSLTHPAVYLLAALGLILSRRAESQWSIQVSNKKLIYLGMGLMLLFTNLVLGGTLAYVSWHQAFGLQFLLGPLAFLYGLAFGKKMNIRYINLVRKSLPISTILVMVSLIRCFTLLIDRGIEWDELHAKNQCLVLKEANTKITGAEIRYPPFDLGIEDVQTWPWMMDNYVAWIKHSQITGKSNCR